MAERELDDGVASLVGAHTDVEAVGLDDPPADEMTKREGAGKPAQPAKPAKLPRGTNVGRYVVLDTLGEGGMGVVYSAYDPELDRKVAVKLLQAKPAAGSTAHGDQAWLLREAQALARLSHPNVIAVHDVGSLPGDRVFIAIELVEGLTLRKWLKQQQPTWRDIRRILLEAGEGLAAAHAAGLVHRDFKPENVLVGNDGRARVMDFGLARSSLNDETPSSRQSDLSIESRSPLSESLTIAGTAVGTPAYMAPEIFDGQAASERSDQFAFGVTLYEALFRQRPYERKALTAPRDAGLAPKPPPKTTVPPRLARIAMRAVAIEPSARYESMRALLDDLAVDPTAAKRRAIYAVCAIAAAGGLVAGALALRPSAPSTQPVLLCKDAERHLAGVWDDKTKSAIKASFAKTSRAMQSKAYAAVEKTLDGYAHEWTTAVTESCEATRIRGEQTEEVQTLRQDCFDQRLHELGAFAKLLTEATDVLVDKAPGGAESLEPVKKCANIAALRAPAQPTPEIRDAVDKAKLRLADAKAGLIAGNYGRALNASEEAADLAQKIPFDPVYAEANLVRGMALINVSNGADAATALEAATWAGLRGRRDDIAAMAALHCSLATTEVLNKPDEGRLWLSLGTAIGKRLGGELDRRFEQTRLETEGIIQATRGDLIAATKAHEEALALAIQLNGKDATIVARDEQLLGATLARAGEWTRAQVHYQRALELIQAMLGPDHPDVALLLSGLASCSHYTGDIEGSRKAFARAIEIRERVFGKNSPVLIPTLNNFGELLRDENDFERGIPLVQRAQTITLKTLGKNHTYYVVTSSTLAELLVLAGKRVEARKLIEEALAVAEQTKSPYLANVLSVRGHIARLDNKLPEAAAFNERAIALFETNVGKDAPEMWRALYDLAQIRIAQKRPADAKPLLERAIAICEKAKLPARFFSDVRDTLAKL